MEKNLSHIIKTPAHQTPKSSFPLHFHMNVWFSLIAASSFIGMAGRTSDEPKIQSAIEGIVHKFISVLPPKSSGKLVLVEKGLCTNFKETVMTYFKYQKLF